VPDYPVGAMFKVEVNESFKAPEDADVKLSMLILAAA
jgi:hypothetical protein